MNTLFDVCFFTFIKALLLLSLLFFCGKSNRIYIWLFILISTLNELALKFGSLYFRPFHLYWNWGGKLLSIFISIILLLLFKHFVKLKPFSEYKLTLKQKIDGKRAIFFAIFFILIFLTGNLIGNNKTFSTETLLFQMTMPGFDEELSFRGIYLTLLNKVFAKKYKFLDIKFGWGLIIVSILFGVVHGLNFKFNDGLSFDLLTILVTGGLGFSFGILAESTNSLVLPVIAHNFFNTFGYLIRVFK